MALLASLSLFTGLDKHRLLSSFGYISQFEAQLTQYPYRQAMALLASLSLFTGLDKHRLLSSFGYISQFEALFTQYPF